VRHRCCGSISLWRICRPRSILSPIYAASPLRTARGIAWASFMQCADVSSSAKDHPTVLPRFDGKGKRSTHRETIRTIARLPTHTRVPVRTA
jgi:hypothetical protein